jgi:signal transduction histidine kinase
MVHRTDVGRNLSQQRLPDERLLGELMRGERGWFEIEKRYRRKDGSELWGHLTMSLGRDARRQPAFLIAMLADATERRRMEEHLREAEKMQGIGRLAGGIAHDFNNLLTGILLYCDLLSAGLEGWFAETDGLKNGRSVNGGTLACRTPAWRTPAWRGAERTVPARGRSPPGGRARGGVDPATVGDRAQTNRGGAAHRDQRNCGFHRESVAAADR